mgnify:CR=1 FL=1
MAAVVWGVNFQSDFFHERREVAAAEVPVFLIPGIAVYEIWLPGGLGFSQKAVIGVQADGGDDDCTALSGFGLAAGYEIITEKYNWTFKQIYEAWKPEHALEVGESGQKSMRSRKGLSMRFSPPWIWRSESS